MTSETKIPEFEGWAVVELMGHRRLAGYVREASAFGTALLRLDVPGAGAPNDGVHDVVATQYYGGGSIYAVTPCTEEIARSIAQRTRETPEPVAYALPAPKKCDAGWLFNTACSPDPAPLPSDVVIDATTICGRHLLEYRKKPETDKGFDPETAPIAGEFERDDRD